MSPYEVDGQLINRVTEIVSAGDCEATAFIEKDPSKRKNVRTSHMVTLPGTLTHARIEQDLKIEVGLAADALPLGEIDKKLYGKLYKEHREMRKKDPACQTTYNDIKEKVKFCYANYLAFRADIKITPLLIEKRMFSVQNYKVGGTVDLVGLFHGLTGYIIEATPDEKHLPVKRYFKLCDHKKACRCTKMNVVGVADWKTSTRKQNGHRIQMSAYFCMLEELGVWDEFRAKGHHILWETISVLLGEHGYKKYKTPYQIHYYSPDVSDFLVHRRVHDNAKNMTINLKGKTGLKGRCMFCAYLPSCPDRIMWNLSGEVMFNTFFTMAELKMMNLLIGKTQSPIFDELRAKAELYMKQSTEETEKIDQYIPEVLKEIETELGILAHT